MALTIKVRSLSDRLFSSVPTKYVFHPGHVDIIMTVVFQSDLYIPFSFISCSA